METTDQGLLLAPRRVRALDALRRIARDWSRDGGGRATFAIIALGVGFVAWMIFKWGGDAHRTLISDVVFLPVSITGSVLAFRAGRHPGLDPQTARAWRIIGVSFFLYWLGDVIWTLEENLGSAPYPSIADIAYVLFYPTLLWGVLTFPTAPRSNTDRTKLWLDTGTVVVGAGMILWYFALGPTAHSVGSDLLESFVSLAYPVGDLVIIFAVTRILLGQPARGSGHALGILAAGLGIFVVADVAFAYLGLHDAYQGGDWPDGLWMVAQVLMVVSAQYQLWYASRPDRTSEMPSSRFRTFSPAPYLAIFASFLLLAAVGWHTAAYPLGGLMIGALLVTTFVVARQIAALRENLRLVEELHHLASTDSLTGLQSRRRFFELAEREFYIATRYKRSLVAMMVDLDHFKTINDSYGHAAGDVVLQVVASRCAQGLRAGDLIGRYGGDEIVVLLPNTDLEAAMTVSDRIRGSEDGLIVLTDHGPVRVTLSMGVATAEDCEDLPQLLHRADIALYEAKQAGRNTTRSIA